jgi:hypothetical protein
VLRGHCEAAQRDYDEIEKTHNNSWLLARDAAAVAAKRERLAARGPLPGFVGTVSEAIDLIGQYQEQRLPERPRDERVARFRGHAALRMGAPNWTRGCGPCQITA